MASCVAHPRLFTHGDCHLHAQRHAELGDSAKISVLRLLYIDGSICWHLSTGGKAYGHRKDRYLYLLPILLDIIYLELYLYHSLHVYRSTRSQVCTFQNFLHALALLPQLVLCRRQRFVSAAALRFLVFLGTKHLYEFVTATWKQPCGA